MASTDEKDEPFVLDEDQCWVLADNDSLKPKVQFLCSEISVSITNKSWEVLIRTTSLVPVSDRSFVAFKWNYVK